MRAVNLGCETDATGTDAGSLPLVLPRQRLATHLPALCDASGELFAGDRMVTRLFRDHGGLGTCVRRRPGREAEPGRIA